MLGAGKTLKYPCEPVSWFWGSSFVKAKLGSKYLDLPRRVGKWQF